MLKNKFARIAASCTGALGAAAAHATGSAVDVSATVTSIGEQLVPIGLLGTAVLAVVVAIKAFHWVRRAM